MGCTEKGSNLGVWSLGIGLGILAGLFFVFLNYAGVADSISTVVICVIFFGFGGIILGGILALSILSAIGTLKFLTGYVSSWEEVL